jgi:hypothetical protein
VCQIGGSKGKIMNEKVGNDGLKEGDCLSTSKDRNSTVDKDDARPVILFLDVDGVLHPTSVLHEMDFSAEQFVLPSACFQHVGALADALDLFPDVKIVVSSSWRDLYELESLRLLLGPLGPRVLETTGRNERTRFAEIESYLSRRRPCDWLALDDDNWGWPDDLLDHLVCPDGTVGLTDADLKQVQARLRVLQSGSARVA